MVLYLLRHGDAVDNPTLLDSERPLSTLGLQQATAAAQFLKRSRVSLDLVVASPLVRARQMAQPAKELLGVQELLTSEYLTPGSSHRQLFELLNIRKPGSALLVGHEPHLSTAIGLLTSGETTARIEMKKASCACVEIPVPIEPGCGVLKWLVTAEQFMVGR